MKIIINKEEFEKALTKVSCALGEKNEDAITRNFGIKVDDKSMKICASSQKISAEYVVACSEQDFTALEGGKAVVDGASILSNVANLHSDVKLKIETAVSVKESIDDEDVSVGTLEINYETKDGEKWSHEHSLLNEKYFPSANIGWDSKHRVEYPAGRFMENIAKSVFAASDEDYKADYGALLLLFEEDGVVFFATDGRQMAYIKDVEVKSKSSKFALIKASVMSKIAKKRILDITKNMEISIKDSKNKSITSQVRIKQGQLSIVSNFADANRLPFEKILRASGEHCKFSINASVLKNGLRVISDLENKDAIWEFTDKNIVIKNKSNYNRKSSGNISGVFNFIGEKCKMEFSTRYWNNILSKCNKDATIDVVVRSPRLPINLSVSNESLICNYFIMPINNVD